MMGKVHNFAEWHFISGVVELFTVFSGLISKPQCGRGSCGLIESYPNSGYSPVLFVNTPIQPAGTSRGTSTLLLAASVV